MKRAVLYLRQSLAKDGDELAVQRQEAECRRICKERGYEITKVITDNNRSASVGKRPGYDELLHMIEAQEMDVVVVYRHDRLLRRLTDLEHLIDLSERTGVQIATVQGDLDLTNSTGRLVGRILASVARAEVETKGERHRLANRQRAEAGKPHGSRRPYGYAADYRSLHPVEAPILAEMAQKIINGMSYRHAAYWMNESGYKTTEGKLWYAITVRNMLRNPRYAGLRRYNGEIVGKGDWQPLFDETTWELLQLTMDRRKQKAGSKPIARKYLLTGFLYCGKCGNGLNGASKRDNPTRPIRPIYYCNTHGDTERKAGCGGVVRNADALNEWIRQCIVYRLDTRKLAELLAADQDNDRLHELLTEREALSRRKESFLDMLVSGEFDRPTYNKAVASVEASLAALEREIDQVAASGLGSVLKAGESIADMWESRPDSWKRVLVDTLIERIDVDQGISKPFFPMPDGSVARFDPSLIRITWRV